MLVIVGSLQPVTELLTDEPKELLELLSATKNLRSTMMSSEFI